MGHKGKVSVEKGVLLCPPSLLWEKDDCRFSSRVESQRVVYRPTDRTERELRRQTLSKSSSSPLVPLSKHLPYWVRSFRTSVRRRRTVKSLL